MLRGGSTTEDDAPRALFLPTTVAVEIRFGSPVLAAAMSAVDHAKSPEFREER
jgi:hypothetical protein